MCFRRNEIFFFRATRQDLNSSEINLTPGSLKLFLSVYITYNTYNLKTHEQFGIAEIHNYYAECFATNLCYKSD